MEAASPTVASLKDYEANPAANLRALEFSNPSAISRLHPNRSLPLFLLPNFGKEVLSLVTC